METAVTKSLQAESRRVPNSPALSVMVVLADSICSPTVPANSPRELAPDVMLSQAEEIREAAVSISGASVSIPSLDPVKALLTVSTRESKAPDALLLRASQAPPIALPAVSIKGAAPSIAFWAVPIGSLTSSPSPVKASDAAVFRPSNTLPKPLSKVPISGQFSSNQVLAAPIPLETSSPNPSMAALTVSFVVVQAPEKSPDRSWPVAVAKPLTVRREIATACFMPWNAELTTLLTPSTEI